MRGFLIVCLLVVSPAAHAVEGMVLFTRGSEFGGMGELRLKVVGGGVDVIESNVGAAVFSPDGTRIVYAHHNGTDWEIVRAKRDGSEKTVLTGGWGEYISLSWRIPDKIVFACNRQKTLWALDPDTGDVSVFYETAADNDFWSVSVATSGNRMTFYSRSVTRGIWIGDIPGRNEVFVDGGCGNAISPDGSRFTNNLHTHQDMYIRNWDQSIYKEIGITGEYFNSQRWSRNSNEWIIYSRGPEFYLEAYSNVYVRNIDTGEEVQVTSAGAHDMHRDFWVGTPPTDPVLSLDKAELTFQATEGGANPAAQDVQVSNSGGGTLADVTVSEDAAWLAVNRSGTGNAQVLTNDVDITGLAPDTYTTTAQVSGGAAGSASYSVTLVVAPDTTDNQPPEVDAGEDQTISLGETVRLNGQVSDDGNPFGTLTIEWTMISGPGRVVFFDPADPETQATFSLDGTYVLSLSADDGQLQASDECTVVVEPGQEPGVTVLAPNGGEKFEVGSTQHILWSPVVVSDVTIRLSCDGGENWDMVAVTVDKNNPQWMDYLWEVPDSPTKEALIRISDYLDAGLSDDSDDVFEICVDCPEEEEEIVVWGECGCSRTDHGGLLGILLLVFYCIRRRTAPSRMP
jgi:hypothetical protein